MGVILWPSIISSSNRYFLQKKEHCCIEYSPVFIAVLPADFNGLRKYLLCNDLYNQQHPFQNVNICFRYDKNSFFPILIENNRFVFQKFHLETMIRFFKIKWLLKGQQVGVFRSGYQVCECNYEAALIFTDNINKDCWAQLHLVIVSNDSEGSEVTPNIAARSQNFLFTFSTL